MKKIQSRQTMNDFRWTIQGLLICVASVAFAGAPAPRYRLVNGKGTTVCEAFLKNLNAFPESDPPMACEVEVHASHPDFSLPHWESMDIQTNLKIIYAAESQMPTLNGRSGIPPLPYDAWVKAFQEGIKAGKAKPVLRKTVLALNSRGPETLISYRPVDKQCQTNFEKIHSATAPEDYIFVLRAGSESLVEKVNLNNAAIVLFKQRPYFFTAGDGGNYWGIHLSYVSPKTPEESGSSQYFGLFRCDFRVANKPILGK
jgi:hypothetical protein